MRHDSRPPNRSHNLKEKYMNTNSSLIGIVLSAILLAPTMASAQDVVGVVENRVFTGYAQNLKSDEKSLKNYQLNLMPYFYSNDSELAKKYMKISHLRKIHTLKLSESDLAKILPVLQKAAETKNLKKPDPKELIEEEYQALLRAKPEDKLPETVTSKLSREYEVQSDSVQLRLQLEKLIGEDKSRGLVSMILFPDKWQTISSTNWNPSTGEMTTKNYQITSEIRIADPTKKGVRVYTIDPSQIKTLKPMKDNPVIKGLPTTTYSTGNSSGSTRVFASPGFNYNSRLNSLTLEEMISLIQDKLDAMRKAGGTKVADPDKQE